MIVLRNLMLAIAAFFVAGVGFYSYLLQALPPDQVQARASTPVASVDSVPAAGQVPPEAPATSSSWGLAAAVLGDFLAARRESAPAAGAPLVAAEINVDVPDWLDQRFDDVASQHDKVLEADDKSRLLTSLLELRALRQQQLAKAPADAGADAGADEGADADAGAAAHRLPDVAMTARAMQAELQFRQTLGVGLAEFMKQMQPQDLARLMAIPEPRTLRQEPPGKLASGGVAGAQPAR